MNWTDESWKETARDYHNERYADRRRDRKSRSRVATAKSSKRDHRGGLPELSLDADPVAVAKELAALIAARRDVLLNGYTPVRVIVEPGQTPYASELTTEAVRTYEPAQRYQHLAAARGRRQHTQRQRLR